MKDPRVERILLGPIAPMLAGLAVANVAVVGAATLVIVTDAWFVGRLGTVALASLEAGQVVLDLGSGAGFDAFLASKAVGSAGRVIGVDFNPKMLARARQLAEDNGYTNVEFREGAIENLPVESATVDVVLSNCVINLSPAKERVYGESMRVLKPDGRLMISDLVVSEPMPGWFLDAVKKPKQVALGVALQYTIMPTLGLVIGKLFPVARPVAVGLILVGCCPGGTASNLVTYLGRANVALSVVLTTASTFLACALTPLMTKTLAGTLVPVPASGLFASTLQVVLLPILGGLALKRWFPDAVKKVTPFCPPFAVATVALVCSSVIGSSSVAIASAGGALIAAVATLHACGFALGYGVACAFGFPEPNRRTVSIEVGMQNSALGVVLATAHFADPLVAVPCAISATVHSCLGSALAGTWRALDDGKSA